MCCCPIRFVQCIVVTVAFIMLIVGSISIGSSVYAKNNQFLIYAGDSEAIALVTLIFGILTTALSLLGIYGGFKRNRLCLLLFAINLLIVLVVQLTISVLIFRTRNSFQKSYSAIKCPGQAAQIDQNVQNIIDAYSHASASFCVKGGCACDYKYTSTNLNVATNGKVDFQQCPQYDPQQYSTSVNLMAAVEATYLCSGLCSAPEPAGFPQLFYFSNVNYNHGESKGLCNDYIWQFINYSSNFGGAMAAGMAGLSLVSFVVLIVLCFHPNKTQYWEIPRDQDQL